MPKSLLELRDVKVVLGGELILENVNMKILEGETAVLIGPSGGGKSVLLKTMAGLFDPAQGTVTCYGINWNELSIIGRHDLSQKVGMQFQKSALFDDLDAGENVAYPLREHWKDASEEKIQQRVDECLAAVGLTHAKAQLPHELSGGMKLRLGVARAIALKPEVLFLDDPTAGLDPIKSDEMAQMILDLKKEIGATLIIVTHDMLRAFQFAGRIFLVAQKTVIETGTAEETRNHPDPRVQQFIHGQIKGPLALNGDS